MTTGFLGANQRNGIFIEVDPSKAGVGGTLVYPALLMGQKLGAGTAPANVPQLIGSADDAAGLFGVGSQLHLMAKAFRKNNPDGKLYGCVVDLAEGAPSIGTLTVSSAPTATGIIPLYVGGVRLDVLVTKDDSTSTVAGKLVAAINAHPELGIESEQDGSDVLMSTLNSGAAYFGFAIGAAYGLSNGSEKLPAGLGLTMDGDSINGAAKFLSGGAGIPNYTAAFAAIEAENFDHFILADWDGTVINNAAEFFDTITGRWSYARNQGGHVFYAYVDDVAEYDGLGQDKEWASLIGLPGTWTPSFVLAAAYGAAAGASLDVYAARPLHDLTLKGVLAPLTADQLTATQVEAMIGFGVTCCSSSYRRGTVTTRNGVTTSLTVNGSSSLVWQPTTRRYMLMRLHRSLYQRLAATFARCVIVQDGTRVKPGLPVCSPSMVRGACLAWYTGQEYAGLVQNAKLFASLLDVAIDSENPQRINVELPPDLVTELTQIAVNDAFRVAA